MSADIIPLPTDTHRFACSLCGCDVHGFGPYTGRPEPMMCIGCTIKRVREGNTDAIAALAEVSGLIGD